MQTLSTAGILFFATFSCCAAAWGQGFSNTKTPVPYATAANQAIVSGVTAPFAWQVQVLPYTSNGSQMTVGGTLDSGSRLSISPQGLAENGISIRTPNGYTGNAIQVNGVPIIRKFSATLGAITGGTSLVIAHGLGTALCTWNVVDINGKSVYPDVKIDATNVTLTFTNSYSAGSFTLIVEG